MKISYYDTSLDRKHLPEYSQGLLCCGISVSLDFYGVTPIVVKAQRTKTKAVLRERCVRKF